MIKVNLLSPERKDVTGVRGDVSDFAEEAKESKISTAAAVSAGVITVAVIGFLYVTQASSLEDKEKLHKEKIARKAQLKDVENTLKDLERTKKDLTRKVALIAQLKARRQSTVKMMDKVSSALPEWVWLTGLKFSGDKLTLSGKAIHNNLIADFINNLKAMGNFLDIEFKGSTRKKQSGLDVFAFNITCSYREKLTSN